MAYHQQPKMPVSCERCGKMFNTSRQHPRRHCSISCEEGRGPLPDSDPASNGYQLYLQANPQSLIGKNVFASALRRTCYSPDWHRDVSDYSSRELVSHDAENETLVRKDDVLLGRVVGFEDNEYTVENQDTETGEVHTFTVCASVTVSQIRNDRWWVGV